MKKVLCTVILVLTFWAPARAGLLCDAAMKSGFRHPGMVTGCIMELAAELWDEMWATDGDDLAG